MKTIRGAKRATRPERCESVASAITFKMNVVYQDNEGKSQFLAAGEPSPWSWIEDIPPRLQRLVGTPEEPARVDTVNQRWIPRQQLESEREALERLNNAEDLDPGVKDALASRDAENLKLAQSRNETLRVIADRHDEEIDRVAEEIEAESRKRLEGGYK